MSALPPDHLDAAALDAALRTTRRRTLALVADLAGEAWSGPVRPTLNPRLWELGHVGWFHDRFVLRHRRSCTSPDRHPDALYDSMAVGHHERWRLPVPDPDATLDALAATLEDLAAELDATPDDRVLLDLVRRTLEHEDMHVENLLATRNRLGEPPPPRVDALPLTDPQPGREVDDPAEDVVAIPAAPGFRLGAVRDGNGTAPHFVYDNEKWATPAPLGAFLLGRRPVTETAFLRFVEDGGYARDTLWSAAGRTWRDAAGTPDSPRRAPRGWARDGAGRWTRRWFGTRVPVAARGAAGLPVVDVCYFEAEAFARWAGGRLPTEAEWEHAACAFAPAPAGPARKPLFPWGDRPGDGAADTDCVHLGPSAPRGPEAGGGPLGLVGHVWEWTASDFLPLQGFEPDLYDAYSQPWFGTRKVLRGGSFATPRRMLRGTLRNFFAPDRDDVFAGFRLVWPPT